MPAQSELIVLTVKHLEVLYATLYPHQLCSFFLSAVKAAFTRAYNKESHLTPYSLQVVKKSHKGAVDPELIGELDSESQVQEEDDDGVTADAMIKVDVKIIIQCLYF